jgi:hypothetical protein
MSLPRIDRAIRSPTWRRTSLPASCPSRAFSRVNPSMSRQTRATGRWSRLAGAIARVICPSAILRLGSPVTASSRARSSSLRFASRSETCAVTSVNSTAVHRSHPSLIVNCRASTHLPWRMSLTPAGNTARPPPGSLAWRPTGDGAGGGAPADQPAGGVEDGQAVAHGVDQLRLEGERLGALGDHPEERGGRRSGARPTDVGGRRDHFVGMYLAPRLAEHRAACSEPLATSHQLDLTPRSAALRLAAQARPEPGPSRYQTAGRTRESGFARSFRPPTDGWSEANVGGVKSQARAGPASCRPLGGSSLLSPTTPSSL